MASYIIGVGGTGARCLNALMYGLSLGFWQGGNTEWNLLLIDADVNNAHKGDIERGLNLYQNLQAVGGSGQVWPRKVAAFSHGGQSLFWTPHERINSSNKSLRTLFEASGGLESDLISMFLPTALIDMELDNGFNAQPAVGAAAIALLSDQKWNQNHPDLMTGFLGKLKQECQGGTEVKVFVLGSIFGGAGAAGIPQLARSIRKIMSSDELRKLRLYAAIATPYFVPPEPSIATVDQRYKEMVGKKLYADLHGNTLRAADVLQNLKEEGLYDGLYMLGDCEPMKLKQWHGGGESQRNPPHFTEMLAAHTICQVLDTQQSNAGERGAAYVFGRDEQRKEIRFRDWPGGAASLKTFETILAHAIFLKFELADIWQSVGKNDNVVALEQYLTMFEDALRWWFEEMRQADEEIKLYSAESGLAALLLEIQKDNPAQYIYGNKKFELVKKYQHCMQLLSGLDAAAIYKKMGKDSEALETMSFAEAFVETWKAFK